MWLRICGVFSQYVAFLWCTTHIIITFIIAISSSAALCHAKIQLDYISHLDILLQPVKMFPSYIALALCLLAVPTPAKIRTENAYDESTSHHFIPKEPMHGVHVLVCLNLLHTYNISQNVQSCTGLFANTNIIIIIM